MSGSPTAQAPSDPSPEDCRINRIFVDKMPIYFTIPAFWAKIVLEHEEESNLTPAALHKM